MALGSLAKIDRYMLKEKVVVHVKRGTITIVTKELQSVIK